MLYIEILASWKAGISLIMVLLRPCMQKTKRDTEIKITQSILTIIN